MAMSTKIMGEKADAAAAGGMQREPLDPVAARAMAIAQAQALAAEGREAVPFGGAGRERQPFGTQEQQLAFPPIPGFRLYWFNETPGRIARAKRAGYDHVLDEETGEPIRRVVDRGEQGRGLNAYLMKIPREWYDADMQAAQEARERTLRDIKDGRHGANPGQNQYVPASGIRIEDRR